MRVRFIIAVLSIQKVSSCHKLRSDGRGYSRAISNWEGTATVDRQWEIIVIRYEVVEEHIHVISTGREKEGT